MVATKMTKQKTIENKNKNIKTNRKTKKKLQNENAAFVA